MATGYVLFNPKAGYMSNAEGIRALPAFQSSTLEFSDITQIENYEEFFSKLEDDDFLIIAGGDGTLNRFVNDTENLDFSGNIFYYPNGTGNDFARDMGGRQERRTIPCYR